MEYILKGEHIKIDTPTIKKHIGRKVEYLLNRDYTSRKGVITEIIRKQVNFGNSEFDPLNTIREIVLLD